jgi:hypothetical protein
MSTVDLASLHVPLRRRLERLRRGDGGFPMSLDGPSEVEATVVAALALDDAVARRWLRSRQRVDGGFEELDRRSSSPASASLASLAIGGQPARSALDFVLAQRRRLLPGAVAPDDHLGWGWASNPDDARAFVEPTARALTALKVVAPDNTSARAEAVRVLTRLRCADGGWNYGTASVNAVDLRGYAQTTAIALVGLQGESSALAEPGLAFLRRSFPVEPGGLTTAQSLLAFRLHGDRDSTGAALDALEEIARRRSFLDRPVAVAWAVLATGPDTLIEPLRWRS